MRKDRRVTYEAWRDYATPWGVEFPGRKTFAGASKIPFARETREDRLYLEEAGRNKQESSTESSRIVFLIRVVALTFVLLAVSVDDSEAGEDENVNLDEIISVMADSDPDDMSVWVGCPDKLEAILEDQKTEKENGI